MRKQRKIFSLAMSRRRLPPGGSGEEGGVPLTDKIHIHDNEPGLDSGSNLPHLPISADLYHPQLEQQDASENGSVVVGDRGGERNAILRHGDQGNVLLLLFLYVLQGIPLGLAGAMPYLLQNRHVSYTQQALFSFVFWPFSLKLLWAPVVDSVYWQRLGGLRKSWLVPTQYMIGGFMLLLSYNTSSILGDESEEPAQPNILLLTILFFCLNFLAATQDIAVDGWALTMLHPQNVGYASTCNTVGQTAGYFLGNIVFLTLESADFANAYIRSEPGPDGVVTLAGFLFFWGLVFLISTSLVFVLKRENPESHENASGILDTYLLLWGIVKKQSVKKYVLILLTMKIAFAAADSVSGLKLIEFGVPKEKLAMLAIPMIPLQIILPWVISKYTNGDRPLNFMLAAYPYRLLMGVVVTGVVYITPSLQVVSTEPDTPSYYPAYYYVMLVIIYAIHQVTLYSMFVAIMAFNARVSDPRIGGTYMTLLNTMTNLGGNWPATLALSCVDWLTFKSCDGAGLSCVTWLDGYYIESAVCTIIGLLWLHRCTRSTLLIQQRDRESWRLDR